MYNVLCETELQDREMEIIEDDIYIEILVYMNQDDLSKLSLLEHFDFVDYATNILSNYVYYDDEFLQLARKYFGKYYDEEKNISALGHENILFEHYVSKYEGY